jgi:hypothetical protein
VAEQPASYGSDAQTDAETTALSRHADDIYKLLLRKLLMFELMAEPTQPDIENLRNLLEEFIMVTRMVKGQK